MASTMKPTDLSPTMREALTMLTTNGAGRVEAWHGGFWTYAGAKSSHNDEDIPEWYAATNTIRALVGRGYLTLRTLTGRLVPTEGDVTEAGYAAVKATTHHVTLSREHITYCLKQAIKEWKELPQTERAKVTTLLVDHGQRTVRQDIEAGREPSEEFGAFDSARRILWALIYDGELDRREELERKKTEEVKMLTEKKARELAAAFWCDWGLDSDPEAKEALAQRFMWAANHPENVVAEEIPIIQRERPTSGPGVASPRYELHTSCCDILVSADDALTILRENAKRQRNVHSSKLVIVDLGPRQ